MPLTVTHALQSVARGAVPSLCAHIQYTIAIAKTRSVSRSAVFHSSRACQHLSEQSMYLMAAALSTGCLGRLLHAHGVLASDCRHAQAVHLNTSQQHTLVSSIKGSFVPSYHKKALQCWPPCLDPPFNPGMTRNVCLHKLCRFRACCQGACSAA